AAVEVEEPPRVVEAARVGSNDRRRVNGICYPQHADFATRAIAVLRPKQQTITSCGCRVPEAHFPLFAVHQDLGPAAAGIYTHQPRLNRWSEDDRPVGQPGAAAGVGRVTDRDGGDIRNLCPHELSADEERQRATIWRPERV